MTGVDGLMVGIPSSLGVLSIFPSKAIAIWHPLDDQGHLRLVESYLREAGNWRDIQGVDPSPRRMFSDSLYAVVARSTGPHAREGESATPDPGAWKAHSQKFALTEF
jgi:hypothetical protein